MESASQEPNIHTQEAHTGEREKQTSIVGTPLDWISVCSSPSAIPVLIYPTATSIICAKNIEYHRDDTLQPLPNYRLEYHSHISHPCIILFLIPRVSHREMEGYSSCLPVSRMDGQMFMKLGGEAQRAVPKRWLPKQGQDHNSEAQNKRSAPQEM